MKNFAFTLVMMPPHTIKPHGDQAEVRAVAHHQAMMDREDREGMAVWKRIRRAASALQADYRPDDAPLN